MKHNQIYLFCLGKLLVFGPVLLFLWGICSVSYNWCIILYNEKLNYFFTKFVSESKSCIRRKVYTGILVGMIQSKHCKGKQSLLLWFLGRFTSLWKTPCWQSLFWLEICVLISSKLSFNSQFSLTSLALEIMVKRKK